MQAGSADYIPHNKALVLKEEKDENEELREEVKELKKSLQDHQKALQDRFDEIKVYSVLITVYVLNLFLVLYLQNLVQEKQ